MNFNWIVNDRLQYLKHLTESKQGNSFTEYDDH